MASLGNFRAELSAVLGLDNRVVGDQLMIDYFVNEGVADVLLRTHCYVLPFDMVVTAGEGDYTLPNPAMLFIEINMNTGNDSTVLERMTPAEIYRLRRGSTATASARAYATSGANLLLLYPTPSSSEDSVFGIYVPRPSTLASESDVPAEIPDEWHKCVSYYALARAADMDDDASSEQGDRYRKLYMEEITHMKSQVYKHGGVRMAPARVLPRSRGVIPDRSVVNW